MLDKKALIKRAIAWEKANLPNTGYTEKVFRSVCEANLPNGTNLLTQIVAQFTGKEETVDLVHWDKEETRTPYSQTSRLTFDKSVDCSSAWYILAQIFFDIDIGTWTEGQYDRLGKIGKKVDWSQRRIFDIVQYNYKSGRRVSHTSGIAVNPVNGKNGMIAHTTSPSNPWRLENDTYGAANRVCVWRFLTDAKYNSLIVDDYKINLPVPPQILKKGMSGPDVKTYQLKLDTHLAKALTGTGYFGDNTVACVKLFQLLNGLKQTGDIDAATRTALDKKP